MWYGLTSVKLGVLEPCHPQVENHRVTGQGREGEEGILAREHSSITLVHQEWSSSSQAKVIPPGSQVYHPGDTPGKDNPKIRMETRMGYLDAYHTPSPV